MRWRPRDGRWSHLAVVAVCATGCTAPQSAAPEVATASEPAPAVDVEAAKAEEQDAMQEILRLSGQLWEDKRRAGVVDPEQREALGSHVEAFLARETHYDPSRLGMAYMMLFLISFENPDAPVETVERALRGMVEYEQHNPHITYIHAPRHLAERYRHFDVARDTIRHGLEIYEPARAADPADEHAAHMVMAMYATLAVVEAAAGDLDAADDASMTARRRADGAAEEVEEAAARVALARGQIEAAEHLFVRGLGISRDCLKCTEGLEQIHRDRGGAPEGFETYLEDVAAGEIEKRKARLLGEIRANGPTLPQIELSDLSDEPWSAEKHRGKVLVINLWTRGCGWCERQMPAYAQLAADYATARDVEILTIVTELEATDVRALFSKMGIDVPTLIAPHETVTAWGVRDFPTTWFVDRKGHIAATATGFSIAVREEYTWRVEKLRGKRARAPKSAGPG